MLDIFALKLHTLQQQRTPDRQVVPLASFLDGKRIKSEKTISFIPSFHWSVVAET